MGKAIERVNSILISKGLFPRYSHCIVFFLEFILLGLEFRDDTYVYMEVVQLLSLPFNLFQIISA